MSFDTFVPSTMATVRLPASEKKPQRPDLQGPGKPLHFTRRGMRGMGKGSRSPTSSSVVPPATTDSFGAGAGPSVMTGKGDKKDHRDWDAVSAAIKLADIYTVPLDDLHPDTETVVVNVPEYPYNLPKQGRSTAFYGSALGLTRDNKLVHPFPRPVEVLANSEGLRWDRKDSCVKGEGRLVYLPERWHALARHAKQFHLTRHEADAMTAEDLRRYWARQTNEKGELKPRARLFFNRLRILEFIRCCCDALLLGLQEAALHRPTYRRGRSFLLSSAQVRFIKRFFALMFDQPARGAQELKRWAGIARSHYFGDRSSPPLPFLLQGLGKRQLLKFSYVGRALPPPPRDPHALKEYVARLQSVPPPEHPRWAAFCEEYLQKWRPTKEVNFRTDPSVSASFGYNRLAGGFTKAVQDLTSLGISLLQCHNRGMPVPFSWPGKKPYDNDPWLVDFIGTPRGFRASCEGRMEPTDEYLVPPPKDFRTLTLRYVSNERLFSQALKLAVHAVLSKVDHIPLLPIYAEEKGLKVRYPATTLAAATLVYQLFRRAIDAHLMQDPRHSASLGGPIPLPVKRMRNHGSGYYYSQDLSFATDLHPFWLTRTAYEAVAKHHPELQEFVVYMPKLFGSHRIILDKDQLPEVPDDPLRATATSFDPSVDPKGLIPDGEVWKDQGIMSANRIIPITGPFLERLHEFILEWNDYLEAVASVEDQALTTTSASMGDATSFPIMPLLTAFCCEEAGLDSYVTAGDDAVISDMTKEKEVIFEETVAMCGGTLSTGDPAKGKPNKIFRSRTCFMFCEDTYSVLGTGFPRRVPTTHISLWSAPPGGSKGSVDWFNQPSSVCQHYEDMGLSVKTPLWKRTKTWHVNSAAYKLGLPLGAPVTFGGTGHPMFPAHAGLNPWTHQKWLSTVSQLTKAELAMGTGLSVIPSGLTDLSRKIIQNEIDALETATLPEGRLHRPVLTEEPTEHVVKSRLNFATRKREVISEEYRDNIMLRDLADSLTQVVTSWEAYVRKPPSPVRTPAVAKVASAFSRKVGRKRLLPIPLSYDDTFLDVYRKVHTYASWKALPAGLHVSGPVGDVDAKGATSSQPRLSRNYGLIPSSVERQERQKAAWEHLAMFRVDRAYLGVKPDSVKSRVA